jgi:SAM-dependent methyltransferase
LGDTEFTGSIPQIYDRRLGPALFRPYAEELAARLAGFEGDLLEVAAGTGIVTEVLDRALPPAARITATDLNPAMLDYAAAKVASPRIRWRPADGQALPFEDASFDAVVCQFGVMFFPDKVQGYREAGRVLREGGRYVFTVWDALEHNPDSRLTHEAVAALFPDDPPGFIGRTPFGYADRERILANLAEAGFADVEIEVVAARGRVDSAHQVAMGYCQGCPLAGEITARDPDGLERATAAAEAALKAHYGDGAYETELQALVVTAMR